MLVCVCVVEINPKECVVSRSASLRLVRQQIFWASEVSLRCRKSRGRFREGFPRYDVSTNCETSVLCHSGSPRGEMKHPLNNASERMQRTLCSHFCTFNLFLLFKFTAMIKCQTWGSHLWVTAVMPFHYGLSLRVHLAWHTTVFSVCPGSTGVFSWSGARQAIKVL